MSVLSQASMHIIEYKDDKQAAPALNLGEW